MTLPLEQIIIGGFALFGAIITGVFSVYTAKVTKKLNKVEQTAKKTEILSVGNDVLEQIVPALERKDEALDKIAEILDNILTTQELTNTQLRSMEQILSRRCMAIELIKAIRHIELAQQRKEKIEALENDIEKAELERKEHVVDELIRCYDETPETEEGGE
jgi:hypothetical protein